MISVSDTNVIGSPTPPTLSLLPFSPMAPTSVATTRTPANASPVPVNGDLPVTETPADPSPIPTDGVLF